MLNKLGFKSIPFYVILFKNRVKIYRLDTKKSIEKNSLKTFSNQRVLLGDFLEVERIIKEIVVALLSESNYILTPPLTILLQQAEMKEGGLSKVEKRALIDSVNHINAKKVYYI